MRQIRIKTFIVGDENVGKTQIYNRITDQKFDNEYNSSIGINMSSKTLQNNVKLSLWDTSGQERFNFVNISIYRDCQMFFHVFDLTNNKSFERVNFHLQQIQSRSPKSLVLLVGNKKDLGCVVCKKNMMQFALENKMRYIAVSAKLMSNIDLLLKVVVELYLSEYYVESKDEWDV